MRSPACWPLHNHIAAATTAMTFIYLLSYQLIYLVIYFIVLLLPRWKKEPHGESMCTLSAAELLCQPAGHWRETGGIMHTRKNQSSCCAAQSLIYLKVSSYYCPMSCQLDSTECLRYFQVGLSIIGLFNCCGTLVPISVPEGLFEEKLFKNQLKRKKIATKTQIFYLAIQIRISFWIQNVGDPSW